MVEGLMGNPNPDFMGPVSPFAAGYQSMWKLIFSFMAFIALFFALRDYILGGNLNNLLECIVTVAVVWIILLQFPVILRAIHDFQQGVADVFQAGILQDANADGLESVLVAAAAYSAEGVTEGPDTSEMGLLARIAAQITHWMATAALEVMRIVLVGTVYVLMLLAFFGQLFGAWGFYLVGIFGPLLIPFYLVKLFSAVADGWLKSMTTMFVYGIVVRVIICMIAWGFGAITTLPSSGNVLTQGIVEFIGVLAWTAFGILMLWKAESIASGLVSGSGTAAATLEGLRNNR